MAYPDNLFKRTGIIGMIGVTAFAFSCSKQEEKDIDKYIASIRKAGMSEGAQAHLRMTASIITGVRIISFPKDDVTGRYGISYKPPFRPGPETDSEELKRFENEYKEKINIEIEKLKSHADFDHSGFISTEEARNFRTLLESGYKVNFVLEDKGKDIIETAKALEITADELKKLTEEYNALAEKLTDIEGNPLSKIEF